MEKIEVKPIGITSSPESPNAFALILKEKDGPRSLPIIIGQFEAQSIAIVLEDVQPPRPLTHDLFKTVLDQLDVKIEEVFINDLRDGTFYARIIFETPQMDIDARPSDAIALAVRFKVPIYVSAKVMKQAGITFGDKHQDIEQEQETDIFSSIDDEEEEEFGFSQPKEPEKPKTRVEKLQEELEKAIKEENYELAAKIRDELKRILES